VGAATKRFSPFPTLKGVTVLALDTATERLWWESAYRTAFPRVYRGLLALGARADEAEDALHDAFLKGFERSKQQPLTSVEGWIFVVASRAWRGRRMRERVLLPWTLFMDREAPSATEASLDVLAAVRALPLRQRQIVVARYILGLSQDETAELLGVARGTVSATTTQAIGALRRRMEVLE
jgi:RNA polymerase sigma-70 factor, ECF subfamily